MPLGFRITQDVIEEQTRLGLLQNSLTFKVGDVVIPTSAGNILTNATAEVAGDFYNLGIIVGFKEANGAVIGQGQNPLFTPQQLITAADNTTVAQYYAQYVPITEITEVYATLSAVAGTTTLSDKAYVYFNLSDAHTLGESSVVAYTNSVPLQFLSYGLWAGDSTNFTVIGRFSKYTLNRP